LHRPTYFMQEKYKYLYRTKEQRER
jgi:hypothetical protein